MSSRGTNGSSPAPWAPPTPPQSPNAERYLLEADALRRRQLRSALLHGSRRTWREQKRIWPAMVAGILVVAVILVSFRVANVIDSVKTAPASSTTESRVSAYAVSDLDRSRS